MNASKADVVFSSGDSYLGMRLSKRLSTRPVFDIYDDYSHFGSNKIPFMRTLLKSAVSKSDLVVCASEPIGKKYRAYQDNILVVQNGVDNSVFRPEEKQVARDKCGVDNDDIVVDYFGSIHKPRGVDDLVTMINSCDVVTMPYKPRRHSETSYLLDIGASINSVRPYRRGATVLTESVSHYYAVIRG
jgi:glycosyltransferase involved in cell wall biosynthesis